MKRFHLFFVFLALFAFAQADGPTPSPTPAPTPVPEYGPDGELIITTESGIKLHEGPFKAKLGKYAEIQVPKGCSFVGPESLKRFFEVTHNFMSGKEMGVIISGEEGWAAYFDYDETGHVKDDEKDSLDADKLYESFKEGMESANAERRSRQWAELKYAGWAAKPHYDDRTNHLKWALKLTSSSDNHRAITINENIRLLGRTGTMNVTLACRDQGFSETEKTIEHVLKGFDFVSGQKYAEFKAGDKVAEYGLAALVLGGAGAVAYKTGLLAKFGKLIVAAVVAVGGMIAKLWNKITGKNKE